MAIENTLSSIRRNANSFSFIDALGSFINNSNFKQGYNQFKVGRDTKDAYIWKTLSCIGEEYGEVIYENVLNYIDNAANVDLCKVKALQSMMQIVGIDYDVLHSFEAIPVEIANLIDILSINRKYLLQSNVFKDAFIEQLLADGIIERNKHDISQLSTVVDIAKVDDGTITDNSLVIDDDRYQQFLEQLYYQVLNNFVFLKYADAENGLRIDTQYTYIYEYIQNELLSHTNALATQQRTQYDKDISELKIKYNIGKSFNQEAIVDSIENGYDSLSNYNTYEQQLLKYEIQYRQSTYSTEKIYDPDDFGLGFNITRYSYYREKKVKEYFRFIEDTYNNLMVESDVGSTIQSEHPIIIQPYKHDINYFDIDQKQMSLLSYDSVSNILVIEMSYITQIAKLLAKQTIEIADIRDQVKLQIRKSYMRGTFLLVSYIVNEFLKYNISYKYGSLFSTNDGVDLGTILDTSITNGDNVQLIEYYDDTEYFNITRDVDDKAKFGESTNEKFWDGVYSKIGVITEDLPLEEIDQFYMKQLQLEKNKVTDIVNFLSIIYEYGANNSFISRKTGEFNCLIPGKELSDDSYYIGNPHTEISLIENDILSVQSILSGINTYIGRGWDNGISATSAQLANLSTWISAEYFWNEISSANEDLKSEVHDQLCNDLDEANEMVSQLNDISSSYGDLLNNSKYSYYISGTPSYVELPNAYFAEKMHNFYLSADHGLVWRYHQLEEDLNARLDAYNTLCVELYEKLFTLSVWPIDSIKSNPYANVKTTYWPYYSPQYENELTTVTTDLKNHLMEQVQLQHDGAMQHLQNHYDALLTYKNDVNRILDDCNNAIAKLEAFKDAVEAATGVPNSQDLEQTITYFDKVVDEMSVLIQYEEQSLTYTGKDGNEKELTWMEPIEADYVPIKAIGYVVAVSSFSSPAIEDGDDIEEQLALLQQRCNYPHFPVLEKRNVMLGSTKDEASVASYHSEVEGYASYVVKKYLKYKTYELDENDKPKGKKLDFEYYVPKYEYKERIYINADIVEYKWKDAYSQEVQSDIINSLDNAIANLTADVKQINTEVGCLGIFDDISLSMPTRNSVREDAESVYEALIKRITALEKIIQASTEAAGWQSIVDKDINLAPFKNRLTRIGEINKKTASKWNIRYIEGEFNKINLSVQNLLADNEEYFENYVHNEADRLDKQILAISAYMLKRDEKAKEEVLSAVKDLSSDYYKLLTDFDSYSMMLNTKMVEGIRDNYEYVLTTILYKTAIYANAEHIPQSQQPYYEYDEAARTSNGWPLRYRDCLDYLLCGDYINESHFQKLSGVLYWLPNQWKQFEESEIYQINAKIPQLDEYIAITGLIDIADRVYSTRIKDEDQTLTKKLEFIIDDMQDQINYISSQIPFYDMSHEIYLKYNGTEIGYDPFYCYKNQAYSSYQIHPYLYNFVEKSNIAYPLANNFFISFTEEYEKDLCKLGIDNILGNHGNIKDLWKSGLFDWTSYQTKYERKANLANFNKGSMSPMVGFTGLFYPPAVNALLNDRDNFLQNVQDDAPESFYHHLNLPEGEQSKIYEQLLAYEHMIKNVATAQGTHRLSGEYDIYRYAEDCMGNSLFLLKSYKHLYEAHSDDPNYSPSYHEKRNTPGELWMRVKNHPLAFPAIDLRNGYADLSQYSIKQKVNSLATDINSYIISLNEYFKTHEDINESTGSINKTGLITRDTIGEYEINGENLEAYDKKLPQDAQHLRCIFDFEMDPLNQAVLLVVPYRTGAEEDSIYEGGFRKIEFNNLKYADSSIVIAYLGDQVRFNATTDQTYVYQFATDVYVQNNTDIDEIPNENMLVNGKMDYSEKQDLNYFTEFIGFAKTLTYVYAVFIIKYFDIDGSKETRDDGFTFIYGDSKKNKPYVHLKYAAYKCHMPLIWNNAMSDALLYDIYDSKKDNDKLKQYDYSNASNVALASGDGYVTVSFVSARRQYNQAGNYNNNSHIVNFIEYSTQVDNYNATEYSGMNIEWPRSTALLQTEDSKHTNIYNSFDSFVQNIVNVSFKFIGNNLSYQTTEYYNLNSDLGYLPQYVDVQGKSHYDQNTALCNHTSYNIELLGPENSDIAFSPVIKTTIDEKYGRVVEEYKEFNKISTFNDSGMTIRRNMRTTSYTFDISSIYINNLTQNFGKPLATALQDWYDLIDTPDLLRYKYIIYNTKYLAMPVLKGNLSDVLPNGYYYQGAELYDLLSGQEILGPNQTTYQNINMTNHIDNICAITANVDFNAETLLPSSVTLCCIARRPDDTDRVIDANQFMMLIYVKNNAMSYEYHHLFENANANITSTIGNITQEQEWSIDFKDISTDLPDYAIEGTDIHPFKKVNDGKYNTLSAPLEFKYSEEDPINLEFPNIDPIDVEDEITIVENDSKSIYFFSIDGYDSLQLDAFKMNVFEPAWYTGDNARISTKKVNPILPKYMNFYKRALVIEATYNLEKKLSQHVQSSSTLYDAEIEYIESTGTQWIDTGIKPTEKTSAQFKVYNKAITGGSIFGYSGQNDTRDYRIFNYDGSICFDIMFSRINGTGWSPGSWRELEIGNYYVKDLETQNILLTGSTKSSFIGDESIKLNYAYDPGQHAVSISQNKWAYVKIYENNVLVRDMIPVRVGQVGYMYDKISGELFGNQGSGNFTLGPDVQSRSINYDKYEIVLYFNYKNFTNPQYVDVKWHYDTNGEIIDEAPDAHVCDSTDKSIEDTYLVVRPGESGRLDLRVDFVEYQKLSTNAISQSIVGAHSQVLKTYYIMNVSDEKPKFIISKKPFSANEGTKEYGNYELEDQYYDGMKFQYAMMIIQATRSSSDPTAVLYNYVAMSKILFRNTKTDEVYHYPSNATVSISDGFHPETTLIVYPNEPINLLIDDDDKEFFASNLTLDSGNYLSILVDLKSPDLDISVFDEWEWYNSHCSNSHVGYIPKKFILAFSNDQKRWYEADSCNDTKNAIKTNNYAKAYSHTLNIIEGISY